MRTLITFICIGLLNLCSQALASCMDVTFNVTATGNNLVFSNPPQPEADPQSCVDFLHEVFLGKISVVDDVNVTGTFKIAATYCTPPPGVKQKGVLEFLVHGITYNKQYWDGLQKFSANSWTNYANARGYHTLAIDVLGYGQSEHPDPVTVTQQFLQSEIHHELLTAVRTGKNSPIGRHDKIACVGHSAGTQLNNHMAFQHPEDCDALIGTGWSQNLNATLFGIVPFGLAGTFNHLAQNPVCALTTLTECGRGQLFYGPKGSFNSEVLHTDFLTEDNYPDGVIAVSVGHDVLADFKGPVLAVNGEKDGIYCPPNQPCQTTLDQIAFLYAQASSFDTFVQPDAGHSLQLHKSARSGFKVAHDWLDKKL